MADTFWDDDAKPVDEKSSFWDDDAQPIAPAYKGNSNNVSFGDVVTHGIPIVGPMASKAGIAAAVAIRGLTGKDSRPFPEQYEDLKARDAADRAAYAEKNPGLDTAGGVMGAFMAPNPVGLGLKGAMATNAAIGAADAYSRDQNAVTGGLLGAGATGVIAGAGKLVGSVPALREYAERRAVKAAGAMTKEMRDLNNAGFLQDTGRELLDKKIITPGVGLETVAERAAAAKEEAGKKIGDAIGKVDDLVAHAGNMIDNGQLFAGASAEEKASAKKYLAENFQFNMENIGNRIENELIAPDIHNPLLSGEMSKLQSLANGFKSSGQVTMREGLGIKGSQRRITNFNSDTIPQGYKQDLYKIIKSELEDNVAKTENLSSFDRFTGMETPEAATEFARGMQNGLPGAGGAENPANAFKAANREYAIMANTEAMANKRFGAAQSNRENSLTDTIAEGAGLIHGGIGGAAALGAINKGMRKYGASTAAVGADKIADLLDKTPEVFGKYAQTLKSAAQKGNSALAVTHYMLSQQDAEYRKVWGNNK